MNHKAYVMYYSGDEVHFYKGLVHRDDGPAISDSLGNKYYYNMGKLYKMIYANGTERSF